MRPAPQVMNAELDVTPLGRLADQRNLQRREVVRKNRDNIDLERYATCLTESAEVEQAGRRVNDQAADLDVDLQH
jgi:hypothetical protein